MNIGQLLKKLKSYKNYVKEFVLLEKIAIEDIHELRVNTRELYSLVDDAEVFYKSLRQVIKLSNKIRDIDVFFEDYLDELPRKYLTKAEKKAIKNIENKSRRKKLYKLNKYLESLVVPSEVKFKCIKSKIKISTPRKLILKQKTLHKYRIYIKKRLYQEKNKILLNKIRIKTLIEIKNILGTINDNTNGLKRLETYNQKPINFEKISKFTNIENEKLFKKFKRVYKEIV